jgi:hypothetical protein
LPPLALLTAVAGSGAEFAHLAGVVREARVTPPELAQRLDGGGVHGCIRRVLGMYEGSMRGVSRVYGRCMMGRV